MTHNTFSEHKNYSNNTIRKKTYRISGKTIIIIDESLVKRLSIDDNTWFIEEEREDGVLLRFTKKVKNLQTIKSKISIDDLIFLHELGNSRTAEIAKYEMAEMHIISIDEINSALQNLHLFGGN